MRYFHPSDEAAAADWNSLTILGSERMLATFGWGPIEQQYRQLPRSQYPATEAARRDYWFAAISAATRRNLAPFFAQWRVPVSAAATQAGAAYPTWLPLEMQKK